MHQDLCVVCLCVYLVSFLIFFLPYYLLSLCFRSYLFTCLLVYFLTGLLLDFLSTPSRIDLFHFQARGGRVVGGDQA